MALLTPRVRTARHPPDGTTDRPPPPLARACPPVRLRVRATLWRLRFVVAALCLGTAAGVTVHALRPDPPPTVAVVVLAHAVPAGTALTAADLVVRDLPAGTLPTGAVRHADVAVDRTVVVDLPAGLPLVPALLTPSALTGPPGTVVTAVRLDDPAVAALLEPGLRLDLVAARPEGGEGATVARRALVLPRPPQADAVGGLLTGTSGSSEAPPVLVAVLPEEAVRIAEASVSSRLVAVVVP